MNDFDIQKAFPMVALRGIVVFPHMVLNFQVQREPSVASFERAMTEDQEIFLVTQRDATAESVADAELYNIGVVARVRQVLRLKNDGIRVLVEGLYRARSTATHYDALAGMTAEVESVEYDLDPDEPETQGRVRALLDAFESFAMASPRISAELLASMREIDSPSRLADSIAANVIVKTEDKQQILETLDVTRRLELLCGLVSREMEIQGIERDISLQVKYNIDKSQREQYMREQIRAIQNKLGEDEEEQQEIEEYKLRVDSLPLPDASKAKITKEINRLSRLNPASPEYAVALTYVEWIMSLPWDVYTEDDMDIAHARRILDEDHYGMRKVKDRILEYLAVRKLKGDMKGPILCFVGPPGVGKTSIAHSIARALGRKFVRMSLGGVHDEAEIRGHRRTYVGAIPGRIVTQIKAAGAMNPVFLFDEIDKMASDFRGDPASAMLEVLDPEINPTFTDHYLDVELDLSKVIFLTTANDASMIPAALYDRMEIIELSSYTDYEKQKIAEEHLVPRQIEENGLTPDMLTIEPEAILRVIEEYTSESGVRSLERRIAEICRKSALKLLEARQNGEPEPCRLTVKKENIQEYLGIPRYLHTRLPKEDTVGVATGLAWTSAGGEVLPVEANFMDGTGKVELTGSLGDVMKESAITAISLVRTRAAQLEIDSDFYKDDDLHVHVPEGATPKDGPSAGITIALAVVSALTRRKIRCDVAMTGEITLTGRVLPIGGLKEKALAAYRYGIRTILIPAENEKDLEDIPAEIASQLRFVRVSEFDDVLREALLP